MSEIPTYPVEWSEADLRRLVHEVEDVIAALRQKGLASEASAVMCLLAQFKAARRH